MTDDECGSLAIFTDGNISISCWKLSFKDRIKILLSGMIWLWIFCGNSHPPVSITINKPQMSNNEV